MNEFVKKSAWSWDLFQRLSTNAGVEEEDTGGVLMLGIGREDQAMGEKKSKSIEA